MIKVRGCTFETNSSSTHSLHISSGTPVYKQPYFPPDVIESGVYELVADGEFGWEVEQYSDMANKLKYLVAHEESCGAEIDPESENIRMIRKVFKDHTGLELVIKPSSDKYYPYGYVDHQSIGVIQPVYENEDTLRRFIFDTKSEIHTDNDNR